MTYTISDIHGCYDKYRELLKKINFGPEDTLYVLRDIIDRGPAGFRILLDMASRFNVVNLLGNYEAMAIDAHSSILRCIDEGEDMLTENEAPYVLNYINLLPLYKEVDVGGRKLILLHGGLEDFSGSSPLMNYAPEEILWCRPEPDTVYYSDNYVIFGHMPVQMPCGEYGNKIPQQNYFITEKLLTSIVAVYSLEGN